MNRVEQSEEGRGKAGGPKPQPRAQRGRRSATSPAGVAGRAGDGAPTPARGCRTCGARTPTARCTRAVAVGCPTGRRLVSVGVHVARRRPLPPATPPDGWTAPAIGGAILM